MSKRKLLNSPLKEVVFELHWDPSIENGQLSDKGYQLAQGRFGDLVKKDNPHHKSLIPENVPFSFFDVPHHQYWKAPFKWPVIQHGQGILAVNEIELGYKWVTFKSLLRATVEKLIKSYDVKLKFNRIKLQYVDSDTTGEVNEKEFIKKNLLTEINNSFSEPGSLKGFNLSQAYTLADGSELQITIGTSLANNPSAKSITWTTIIEKSQRFNEINEVFDWVENAHNIASKMFVEMLSPEYYDSLDK